jgi:hypothetical protein
VTPPLVCPSPAQPRQKDCPLYAQRVAYSPDEALRRAILTESQRSPSLADLIRAEPGPADPARPALPPAPAPLPLSLFDQLRKENQ